MLLLQTHFSLKASCTPGHPPLAHAVHLECPFSQNPLFKILFIPQESFQMPPFLGTSSNFYTSILHSSL